MDKNGTIEENASITPPHSSKIPKGMKSLQQTQKFEQLIFEELIDGRQHGEGSDLEPVRPPKQNAFWSLFLPCLKAEDLGGSEYLGNQKAPANESCHVESLDLSSVAKREVFDSYAMKSKFKDPAQSLQQKYGQEVGTRVLEDNGKQDVPTRPQQSVFKRKNSKKNGNEEEFEEKSLNLSVDHVEKEQAHKGRSKLNVANIEVPSKSMTLSAAPAQMVDRIQVLSMLKVKLKASKSKVEKLKQENWDAVKSMVSGIDFGSLVELPSLPIPEEPEPLHQPSMATKQTLKSILKERILGGLNRGKEKKRLVWGVVDIYFI